jgi:hypothetical protein
MNLRPLISLHAFLSQKHIRARMKEFRPDEPRVIDAPIRTEPRSARFALIGSSFDYLLRFEIARRVPAVEERWIADHVADGDCRRHFAFLKNEIREFCESRRDFNKDNFADVQEYSRPVRKGQITSRIAFTDPFEIYFLQAVRKVVHEARSEIAAFRRMQRPSVGEQKQAAFHAVRLAKVDAFFRAASLDPTFEIAERDDVAELVELLTIVPWERLLGTDPPLLNPTLGCRELGIGTDADLISSGCLIEVKVTKNRSMLPEWLDQLLGYFIMLRFHGQANRTFPKVSRLGLYFARHGHFWVRDTRVWTDRPGFADFEQWFLSQMPGRLPSD